MPYSLQPMDCSPPGFLSMGSSRQGYWSGLPFPSPGNFPDPAIEPGLLHALQADSLPNELPGTFPQYRIFQTQIIVPRCRNTTLWLSSVAQSCPTLCNLMDCSTPCIPVHHQLLELTQTHVHRVSDAIQPSHPLSSSSPPAFNLS